MPAESCESLVNDRLNLKKWGLSYCINEHMQGEYIKSQAGMALGGYLQLGGHDLEVPYRKVRAFFDHGMKKVGVAKESGEPLPFMRCLNLYESQEYQELIVSQDRYTNWTSP